MKREYAEDNPSSDTNKMMLHQHHPTTSDETDSHNPPPPSQPIEVVRRPRGRPPGSKNKTKPPLIINNSDMSPYVLELPQGADIVVSTTHFCRKRNIGLCILNGHGVVSNVTLRQPSSMTNPPTVTFHGRFELLSISATISDALSAGPNFAISLAGPQGQVVGGLAVGPLVAAGTVYLIAATFNSPSFHRLHEEQQPASDTFNNNNYQPPSDVVWAPMS